MLVFSCYILLTLFSTWTGCSLSEKRVIYNSTVESSTDPVPGWDFFDENKIYSNFDSVKWIFNSNSGNTGPEYIVCAGSQQTTVNNSLESNWLVSNYYTSDANVIHVRVDCRKFPIYPNSGLNCHEVFTIHFYESDSPVNVSESLNLFIEIETSVTESNSSVLAKIGKSKRGFYIAFHNTGYCVGLTSFLFYYEICPAIQSNSLPETPVPRESEEPTAFNLSCPVGSVSFQQAECYSNGSWRVPESVECVCERGWREVTSSNSSNLSCVACPENTYKDVIGNERGCVSCPEMSSTNGMTASVMCECDDGWYRSEEESVDLLCGRSPSVVRNIRLERGTESVEETRDIRVMWEEPADVWNRSVSYNVSLYSDGLWWSGRRTDNLFYELSESEFGESSREYLLEVTSLNTLSVLSGVENNVSVRFVSRFPEVVNGSLRWNASGSLVEWEYNKLEGGVSELSFELNYTSIGGEMRQERVNGCSPVSPAVYRCSVTVIELDENMDIVLTLIPLSSNEIGDTLSRSFNLSKEYVLNSHTTSSIIINSSPSYPVTNGTPPSSEMPLLVESIMFYLILSSLLLTVFIFICLLMSFIVCCLLIKKRFLKICRFFSATKDTAKYVMVDDATEKPRTNQSSYQNPDMFVNLRDAVRYFAKEVNNSDIKIDRVIGNGEFGDVCKGTLNQDGHSIEVALKTLKPDIPEKHKLDFYREASVMGQFDNENIIRLLGVTLQHPVMIVTPFMSNGSLDVFLQDRKQDLTLEQQGKIALGVASGMVYLSSISFVHRDLAARNVLVAHNLTPKIIDFGLSRETEEDVYTMSKGGLVAVRWTALEAILYKRFNTASDVWSFGVLLWEIMSLGTMPYKELDLIPLVEQLQVGYRMQAPDYCPHQLYQLMSSCWLEDPIQRPSFVEIHSILSKLIESHFGNSKRNRLSSSNQADHMNFSSVLDWLASLEMDRYEENFTENGYSSISTVWRLDQHDLLRIGIIPCKHRNKIMTSIRKTNQLLGLDKRITETTRV